MSDAGNEAEGEIVMDLNKMKMSELKGELAARGLKISGKKSELVDRLQQYLEEHEDAEVEEGDDDDALLDDTVDVGADAEPAAAEAAEDEQPEPANGGTEESPVDDDKVELDDEAAAEVEQGAVEQEADKADDSEPAATESNGDVAEADPQPAAEEATAVDVAETTNTDDVVKADEDVKDEAKEEVVAKPANNIPRIEFPSAPAEKSKEDKKDEAEQKRLRDQERIEKRKARFGNLITNGKSSDSKSSAPSKKTMSKISKDGTDIDMEKVKSRAERFGMSVSDALTKAEQSDAAEKRKRRFGGDSVSASGDSEVDSKKAKRAERFKTAEAV